MLELGKPGGPGLEKGDRPVLDAGDVVATLHASNWKETATAEIAGRQWVFSKDGRELTGRDAGDPAGTARLRAWQTSWWKGTWHVELDGVPVEVANASMWKGTHRYATGGREVAESGTTGGWSPRPTLTADASLALHAQVFLLWVEFVIGRRTSAAAAV